jgi:hypothetical protein
MISSQIRQMRPFFFIGQVRADAVHHDQNERAIIHIEPIRPTDKFIGTVSNERAIDILGHVRLVESRHELWFLVAPEALQIYRHGGRLR